MITFAQKEDTEQIKRLWRKTFDDTEEEIEAFLKYYSSLLYGFWQLVTASY